MHPFPLSKLTYLTEVIDIYRGHILDAVENSVGDLPQWPPLRAKLLKLLGDNGLPLRIQQVLGSEKGGT